MFTIHDPASISVTRHQEVGAFSNFYTIEIAFTDRYGDVSRLKVFSDKELPPLETSASESTDTEARKGAVHG